MRSIEATRLGETNAFSPRESVSHLIQEERIACSIQEGVYEGECIRKWKHIFKFFLFQILKSCKMYNIDEEWVRDSLNITKINQGSKL